LAPRMRCVEATGVTAGWAALAEWLTARAVEVWAVAVTA